MRNNCLVEGLPSIKIKNIIRKLPKKVALTIVKNSSNGERIYQFLYKPENQKMSNQYPVRNNVIKKI
jgi:hypothetical protein